jgi:hypothetical protein
VALRLLLLLVALVLAGCGGDDEEGAPETAAATNSAAASSCVPAGSDLMAPLGGRVTLAEGRLRNGRLVQSEAAPDWWFVAVELDGPGYEDDGDVATFATTSQYGGEAIFAADALAQEHTTLRSVAEAEGVDAADPAAGTARACVSG